MTSAIPPAFTCDPEACATEAGFLLAEILRREVEG